jgi:hypothetical protein
MEQAEIDRYAVSLVGGPAIVAGLNQRRRHGAIGKVPPAAHEAISYPQHQEPKEGPMSPTVPDSTNPGQLRELIRHAGDSAGRALRSETDERPHIEAYEVPAQPMDRVLDLRHWVKWNVDGSLTFAAPARMGSAARTRC